MQRMPIHENVFNTVIETLLMDFVWNCCSPLTEVYEVTLRTLY